MGASSCEHSISLSRRSCSPSSPPLTYSTSALQPASAATLTEDTLSMISTPWTTESFDSDTFDLSGLPDSSSYTSWDSCATTSSSSTPQPLTTASSGIPSPVVLTEGGLTVTLLKEVASASASRSLRPGPVRRGSPATLSSWSLESYTSSGRRSGASAGALRVRYPWSPSTARSGSDAYPSTQSASRRSSRATLASLGLSERGHITPLQYVGLAARLGAGLPPGPAPDASPVNVGETLSAIVAM